MGEGWQIVPPADEPVIRAAWAACLQPADELIIPAPSRSWRGQALTRHRPALESEFAAKLLAAFRRCCRLGERLWVIDWAHAWFSLDPHSATGERPVPALPDGDSYNYVAQDFRFGLVMGWRDAGPVTLFGAGLLAAFFADPPSEFLRLCGPGEPRQADHS